MRFLSPLMLGSILALTGCSETPSTENANVPRVATTLVDAEPAESTAVVTQVAIASGKGSRALVDAHGATGSVSQVAVASGKGSVAMNAAGDINLSDPPVVKSKVPPARDTAR